MSLAPTNSRGARLYARFAVKGIQSSSSDGSVEAVGAAGAVRISVAIGTETGKRDSAGVESAGGGDSARADKRLRSINMDTHLRMGEETPMTRVRRTGNDERRTTSRDDGNE